MSLVIDLEAKSAGGGGSYGESALSYMATASEEAMTIFSGKCSVNPLRQRWKATLGHHCWRRGRLSLGVEIPLLIGIEEATFAGDGASGANPTGKEDSSEFRGSVFPVSSGSSTWPHPKVQNPILSQAVHSL